MLPNLFHRIMFFDKLHAICTRYRSFRYSGIFLKKKNYVSISLKNIYTPLHRRGVYCFTSVRPSKIFFVAFFSATIDGKNLIFGHTLHIGMPYCGKRFWTRQIPTSCLLTQLVFKHIEHICRGFISEHQLTVHLVYFAPQCM